MLASDPRIQSAHERARAAAVGAANERRDPTAPRVATSTTLHRVALGLALLAGVLAVALLTTTRSSAIALQNVMLPSGLLAVLSVALLWWLEPRRANGSLWGSRVPAVIHLALAVMWTLVAVAVVVFRWGEISTFAALPSIAGLTLLGCAVVAALILCGQAHRADRSGRQTGVARVTGDLIDKRDRPEVFAALDRWWSTTGPETMRQSSARVLDVRLEVLARLKAVRLITEREERLATYAPEPLTWAERRR